MHGQWIFVYVSFFTKLVYAKQLVSYSNNKPGGSVVFIPESDVTDFVAIAKDPVSNLTDQFTICTSLYFGTVTTSQNVVHVYKDDETHWFNIYFMSSKNLRNGKTETLKMWYDTSNTIINSLPNITVLSLQISLRKRTKGRPSIQNCSAGCSTLLVSHLSWSGHHLRASQDCC